MIIIISGPMMYFVKKNTVLLHFHSCYLYHWTKFFHLEVVPRLNNSFQINKIIVEQTER